MSLDTAMSALLDAKLTPLLAELRRLSSEVAAIQRALPPQLITIHEAAQALGVSVSTVRRQVRTGHLPSRRVGRSLRVDLRPVSDDEVRRRIAYYRAKRGPR